MMRCVYAAQSERDLNCGTEADVMKNDKIRTEVCDVCVFSRNKIKVTKYAVNIRSQKKMLLACSRAQRLNADGNVR